MAYIMGPKEESEVSVIKKACQASMDLFNKYLKEQLMDLIDKDKVIQLTKSYNHIYNHKRNQIVIFVFVESEACETCGSSRRGTAQ